jgi:hypothetical protein
MQITRSGVCQGSYHPGSTHSQGRESSHVTRIDAGQWAYTLILAIVPPCAGECRLVRVIGVLIFANAQTCVASVLKESADTWRLNYTKCSVVHHVGVLVRMPGVSRARQPTGVAASLCPGQSAI